MNKTQNFVEGADFLETSELAFAGGECQSRSATARGGVAGFSSTKRPVTDWRGLEEFFSRKISVFQKRRAEKEVLRSK